MVFANTIMCLQLPWLYIMHGCAVRYEDSDRHYNSFEDLADVGKKGVNE